jgi:para-aminobenzoate synthetase component 1
VDRRDLVSLIEKPGAALLDGWSDGGRWTIALPDPVEELRVEWGEEEKLDEFLRGRALEWRGETTSSPAPFAGGWVGFLAYEVGALWEGAEPRREHPPEPAAIFHRHDSGIAVGPTGEVVRFGDKFAERIPPVPPVSPSWAPGGLHDSLSEAGYRRAHELAREGIARGDFYQVNLTRRFRAPHSPRPDAREIFSRLAGEAPPPYSLMLRGTAADVLSASPELFLRADFQAGTAEMRPIKGTAARSKDPVRDAESERRLRASAKDRAENVMIVDLCRNDLGKVCETGTVRVTDLCRVRSHRVHHLESTVVGRLRPGVAPLELLRATFPPGSVTGAPKRAAVRAIRGLEPVARGVYTGAAGYLDRRGRLAFNVAIRTTVVSDGEVRYHAGGGIVWDSVAEDEREEGDLKAEEFFSLFEGPGKQSPEESPA